MDIGYIWDEEKLKKTKEKHGISFAEVVSVMENPNSLDEPKEDAYLDGEDRWVCVGETFGGKLVVIIYVEEFPLIRIITAFEAEGKWVDEYKKR